MPTTDRQRTDLVIELDAYEGPLDLLVDLARDHKIDLSQISMNDLVEQYLVFLDRHSSAHLELSADYLVMAAWLAFLKSSAVLARYRLEAENEEAAEVLEALHDQHRRLHAMEKSAANWLSLPRLGRDVFTHRGDRTVRSLSRPRWLDGYRSYLDECVPDELPRKPSPLRIAATDLFSVEDAIGRVEAFLNAQPGWNMLERCLPNGLRDIRARSAVASHLVAALELCRQDKIDVRQDAERFSPIWLKLRGHVE